MGFRNNLQHLRATRNMTQEQLAMMVGVSRQSVTKWEAEKAYPDMDKLLKLCNIFGCTLDELVQGDLTSRPEEPGLGIAAGPAQDVCGYDEHMRRFARNIAVGVGLMILATSSAAVIKSINLESLPVDSDALSGVAFLVLALLGLFFLVPAGMDRSAFAKAHPYVENFYTQEDRERANRFFTQGIVGGIAVIFAGVICAIIFPEAAWIGSAFLVFVAVGVAVIIYASIMHGRVNVSEYNDSVLGSLSDDKIRELDGDNADAIIRKRHHAGRTGAMCGVVMLVATAIALLLLFLSFDPQMPRTLGMLFWVPWPLGGIACGIVNLLHRS